MKIDEEKFVSEARKCLYSSMEIDKSLFALFNYLKKYLPLNLLATPVFDIRSKSLRYLALATEKGGLFAAISFEVSMESAKHLWGIRDQISIFDQPNQIPVIEELRAFFFKNPYFDLSENFSTLAIPLQSIYPVYGGLALIASGENRYNRNHVHLVKLLEKPSAKAISNLLRFREIIRRNENTGNHPFTEKKPVKRYTDVQVIGAESGLKAVMDMMYQVAPLNSPVLILGETGVGKEVIAQAIHDYSDRSKEPIVVVNCGAIPETLIDSELFGHIKGSFTGATTDKKGYFEQANGGTIFLDEIGELSQQAQVKLLRVLQYMEFYPVGGTKPISVDVRVIAATHQDLPEMVVENKFRQDLWYRLNVFPIHIPPLRERKEDIPLLSEFFAIEKAKEMNYQIPPSFAPDAFEQLQRYPWPGNVRELQNVIERAIIIGRNKPLSFNNMFHYPQKSTTNPFPVQDSKETVLSMDEMSRLHILNCLKLTKGRIEGEDGAAEILGMNPSTLRSRMRKLDIKFGRGQSY